jgi:hypothetical protein
LEDGAAAALELLEDGAVVLDDGDNLNTSVRELDEMRQEMRRKYDPLALGVGGEDFCGLLQGSNLPPEVKERSDRESMEKFTEAQFSMSKQMGAIPCTRVL